MIDLNAWLSRRPPREREMLVREAAAILARTVPDPRAREAKIASIVNAESLPRNIVALMYHVSLTKNGGLVE